eukprot:TRINITY_DN2490_c0_g1_i2.p1 TRINITY_DN2490_c0_g1~~TRINITY_DN2490_c0_g1_i2.p1  ORF type:complete len:795 (+),score=270.30 TRINITY_DN2490_c0_g1_i2:115-2499(+)
MGDFEFDDDDEDMSEQEPEEQQAPDAAAAAAASAAPAAKEDVPMSTEEGIAAPLASFACVADLPVDITMCPPDTDFRTALPEMPVPAPVAPPASARRPPTAKELLSLCFGFAATPRWLAFDPFGQAAQLDGALAWDGGGDEAGQIDPAASAAAAPVAASALPPKPGRDGAVEKVAKAAKAKDLKREARLKQRKSALLPEEHKALLQKKKKGNVQEDTQREVLMQWVGKEQEAFRALEVTESRRCNLCAAVKKEHMHRNHLWLFPAVAAAYTAKKAARHAAGDAGRRYLLRGTALTAAAPASAGDLVPLQLLHHYGVVGTLPRVAVPAVLPCRQVDPRRVGRHDPEDGSAKEGYTLSGVDYLSFPGLALTASRADAADGTAPQAKRRKRTARELATEKAPPARPRAREWVKQPPVALADDAVLKGVLAKVEALPQEQGTPWFVATPAVLAALLTGGRLKGSRCAVPVTRRTSGRCAFLELPCVKVGGAVRPRTANTSRFKDALLTYLARHHTPEEPVVHTQLATAFAAPPAGKAKAVQLDTWDPNASSSDDEAAPEPAPAVPLNNFSYAAYNLAPHNVLVRGQIDALVDGAPVVVRAHMEYNNKDWLATMDDPAFLLHEAFSRDELVELWCALAFRPTGVKALVGRVNAFTSSVIGWDLLTLEDVEARLAEVTEAPSAANALRAQLSAVMQDILTHTAAKDGEYAVECTNGALQLLAESDGTADTSSSTLPLAPLKVDLRDSAEDYRPTGSWARAGQLPQTFQIATELNFNPWKRKWQDDVADNESALFTSEGRV